MIALKKTWIWLKHYWYFPVIVVLAIAAFIFTGGRSRSLISVIANAMDSHSKEVYAIEKTHQEEIEKREKALTLYHFTIALIESKLKGQEEKLDEKKKKEIKRLIEENQDNPEELAKRISDFTGFPVVMPEE